MKVALFTGDARRPRTGDRDYLSMHDVLALAEHDPRRPLLRVLLVPDDFDLAQLHGAGWGDAQLTSVVDAPYESSLPEGARWVLLGPGDPWPVV